MENKIKIFEKELKYLTKEAREYEINKHKEKLNDNNINLRKVANEIYSERGIDPHKLNRNITNNLINNLLLAFTGFKDKDKTIKNKMIIDIIYLILIIILLKIPFNLVRDIGYDYIEILSTNNLFYNVWNLTFLLIYTITAICSLIVLLNNFNNKYLK